MIRLHIANGSGPTGRTLAQLLAQAGVNLDRGPVEANVSYGVRLASATLPSLNANAGRYNKLQQLLTLQEKGVPTLRVLERGANFETARYPLVGRKVQHREGKDIMLALQPEDVPMRLAAGCTFFTEYVPRSRECRVWVFRRRHLGTYEKVMRHPEQYKYYGCSYRNGFAFELVPAERVPRDAVEIAANAVNALGLDFGAVDMLLGKDGQWRVLEVNTAPGVEGPGRQVIQALASKIATWVQGGFKRRNGAGDDEPGRPVAAPIRQQNPPAMPRNRGYF